MIHVKVKAYKFGLMVHDMKDIGKVIKQMEGVDSYMLMVMCMKETGEMIKLMEMEFILMLMDPVIRVVGLMTNSMVMVLKNGLMALHMKEHT